MGVVYLAHDPQLERLVALKVPRPVGDDVDHWRKRFQDEARAAATLQHPNICSVFEVGEVDSRPYLTMAYIEGESLATKLKRVKSIPILEAVRLVRTAAAAMAEAHERGIIHRDLKPANVMIDRRGQPIIMDFGLALRASVSERLTLSGIAVGTPAYMAPEQAGVGNAGVGPPTDVYALGVILYELVTGGVPFKAKAYGKLLAQIERDPPPIPSSVNPDVDAALEALLLTALDKAPAKRFATAGAFAEALDAYVRGERDSLMARYGTAEKRTVPVTGPYVPGQDQQGAAVPAPSPAARSRRRWRVALGMMGFVILVPLGSIIYVLTTKPTPDMAGQPPNQTADPKQLDPARPALPKPVAYPKAPTFVENPGWQFLADATRDEMEKWLTERKNAGHAVKWLDVFSVEGKPAYIAIAGLDERQPDWSAALDVPAADLSNATALAKWVSTKTHRPVAAAGFEREGHTRVALLTTPGDAQWFVRSGYTAAFLDQFVQELKPYGMAVRILRPHATADGDHYTVGAVGKSHGRSVHAAGMTAAELAAFLDKHRAADFCPISIAAAVQNRELRFSAVVAENPTKADWEVHHDLAVDALKAKALEMAFKDFTPTCITGYTWDGAVRYVGVWVKGLPNHN
jgi:hypothetical protein